MSFSNYAETLMLTLHRGSTLFSATMYLKLHTGNPGEDGTANAANTTTRRQIIFSAPSGGSMSLGSTPQTWTMLAESGPITHFTLWDATSAGNCYWIGEFQAPISTMAGSTLQITSLTLTID